MKFRKKVLVGETEKEKFFGRDEKKKFIIRPSIEISPIRKRERKKNEETQRETDE